MFWVAKEKIGIENFKRLMSAKLDLSAAWKILDPNSLGNYRTWLSKMKLKDEQGKIIQEKGSSSSKQEMGAGLLNTMLYGKS